MDAFRETHELMDSLIASYQAGCKDDTDAVREVQRLVEESLSGAGDKEQQVLAAIKGEGTERRPGAAWRSYAASASGTHLAHVMPTCLQAHINSGLWVISVRVRSRPPPQPHHPPPTLTPATHPPPQA